MLVVISYDSGGEGGGGFVWVFFFFTYRVK